MATKVMATGSPHGTTGGGEGTRTLNPLLAKQVRCQLRYAPGNGTSATPAQTVLLLRESI